MDVTEQLRSNTFWAAWQYAQIRTPRIVQDAQVTKMSICNVTKLHWCNVTKMQDHNVNYLCKCNMIKAAVCHM